MRTLQFVGLTADALNFVSNATKTILYDMADFEPYQGDVKGRIYYCPYDGTGPNIEYRAVERVQKVCHSSGPVILTHLELYLVKESGQEVSLGNIYSWVADPMIKNEVDIEKGRYWI